MIVPVPVGFFSEVHPPELRQERLKIDVRALEMVDYQAQKGYDGRQEGENIYQVDQGNYRLRPVGRQGSGGQSETSDRRCGGQERQYAPRQY